MRLQILLFSLLAGVSGFDMAGPDSSLAPDTESRAVLHAGTGLSIAATANLVVEMGSSSRFDMQFDPVTDGSLVSEITFRDGYVTHRHVKEAGCEFLMADVNLQAVGEVWARARNGNEVVLLTDVGSGAGVKMGMEVFGDPTSEHWYWRCDGQRNCYWEVEFDYDSGGYTSDAAGASVKLPDGSIKEITHAGFVIGGRPKDAGLQPLSLTLQRETGQSLTNVQIERLESADEYSGDEGRR